MPNLTDFSNVLASADPALLIAIFLALFFLGLVVGFFLGKRLKKNAVIEGASGTQDHAENPAWHVLSPEQAIAKQNSDEHLGLSEQAAAERLLRFGLNRLTAKPPRSPWLLFFSQFNNVLIMVLIAAAVVAAAIGDVADGIVILVVVLINAILGFSQEFQAEKSLAALKKMLALQAKVQRNGKTFVIPAEQLVPGDMVMLEAGDKIPADGRIIKTNSLEADESSLTGESVPSQKQLEALTLENAPLAERSNMLYMNNAITRGRAQMLVTATGMETEIGKLATLLSEAEENPTQLQLQLDDLGKRLAMIALFVVAALFASSLWRGEPLLETAFTAIALAVAAIPEGLPAVVTVTLALGMHRMAQQRAIVKRLAAVETLGCTTVICTDKTGTLTVNQMTARALFYKGRNYHVSGEGYDAVGHIIADVKALAPLAMDDLLAPLALCNNSQWQGEQVIGDPMEGALLVLVAKGGMDAANLALAMPRVGEIPFDAAHKYMATFHHHKPSNTVKVFVKGAPEVLIKHCATMFDAQGQAVTIEPDNLWKENAAMAATGLRVIAVAMLDIPLADFKADGDLSAYIKDLSFVALVGLMDPPRAEARDAIKLCLRAGIAVKMITGDQKITAATIAKELGIMGEVIDGMELGQLDDAALAARINSIAVFARTAPEQKVRIVNALKTDGHVVAMTGDGVNDAPALKSADIGIAMGVSGTDVAQEAATMILTDDNFATITKAIKEGRGIYENMVKFVRFQLATNIGAILTVATAPLLGLPVPFTAVQLLWINIIMDGPPALSLGIDPCRKGIMHEGPRDPEARILSLKRFGNLFVYGLTMAVGTLGLLYFDLLKGDRSHATTLAFTTFVLFQVVNVFNARSEKGSSFNRNFFANKYLWLAILGVLFLQVVVIHWPPAQKLFHTTELSLDDWLLASCVALSVLLFEEMRKVIGWIFSATPGKNKALPSGTWKKRS